MKRIIVLPVCLLLFSLQAFTQAINKIEYFIDTDPGFGNGVNVSATPSANIADLPVTVDISSLSRGLHNIYLRSKDNAGSWSLTNRWLFVKDAVAATITALEYFIDTDPGFGNGITVSITPSGIISDLLIPVDISALNKGFHNVYLRSKDNAGDWSLTNRWLFIKDEPAGNINKLEYFIDTDPGFGNGIDVALTPSGNIADMLLAVDISALSKGFHNIYLRSKDNSGSWTITNRWIFFKDLTQDNFESGEYFFDTDPGFGNGTAIPFGGSLGTGITDFSFTAGLSGLPNGSHYLFIRTKEANGKWSLTNMFPFTKTVVLPVSLLNFAATAESAKVLLTWQTSTEINNDHFEIERSTDGRSFMKIGQVAGAGNSNSLLSYSYYDEHPLKGKNYYRLRQVDIDGKKDYSETRRVDFKGDFYWTILNNPSKGKPVIIKTSGINSLISIFDAAGRKIRDIAVLTNNVTIPVDQLAAGVYIVVLHKDGEIKATDRIVVNH